MRKVGKSQAKGKWWNNLSDSSCNMHSSLLRKCTVVFCFYFFLNEMLAASKWLSYSYGLIQNNVPNSNKGTWWPHLHVSPSPCQKCTCVSRIPWMVLFNQIKVELQYILLLKQMLLSLAVLGFFVFFWPFLLFSLVV